MSRPRKYDERVPFNVRLEKDLHAALMAAAEERMVSANLLATKAIADFLPRLLPLDQIRFAAPEDGPPSDPSTDA